MVAESFPVGVIIVMTAEAARIPVRAITVEGWHLPVKDNRRATAVEGNHLPAGARRWTATVEVKHLPALVEGNLLPRPNMAKVNQL